jgi:large subunit ribosomal protein L11
MAAKPIKTVIKVTLQAGSATPAPPLGPILGQHGVNIMEFVKQYNDKTADKRGEVVPAVITIYEDRSFDFELKLAPVTDMIKKKLRIDKGSGETPRKTVGVLKMSDVEEIAKEKMPDLNANDIEAAKKIVIGSARSMGVKVE